MEQLTTVNIILVLLGLALNSLLRYKAVKRENNFQLGFWIKDNWVDVAITLITAAACLIMAEDILMSLGVYPIKGASFFKIHAFLCGLVPNLLLVKIREILKI